MYISASAPDAPPLSETTIGCFIRLFFWIAACIMRAIWSEAPPAPAATTISTGLVGSQAASDALEQAAAAKAAAQKLNFLLMALLLVGIAPPYAAWRAAALAHSVRYSVAALTPSALAGTPASLRPIST